MDNNPVMKSKTVLTNSLVFAIYTIAKWINPDLEVPQDVLVSFLTVGNLLLRFVTKSPLGG